MGKPVVLTRIAEQDLEQITSYLSENWDALVCDNFLSRFEELCDTISASPAMFPVIYKRKKIRKCTLTRQNTMYYRERTREIEIITIFDTRQDPNKLKGFLND